METRQRPNRDFFGDPPLSKRGRLNIAVSETPTASQPSAYRVISTMNVKRFCCLLLLLCAGCSSRPRGTDSWTEKIKASHVLTVGVERIPRNDHDNTAISPRERAVVQALANRLGAKVQYREGNVLKLLHSLEEREYPVLCSQIRADSPYVGGVALSRPYGEVDGAKRCIAVAPGQDHLLQLVDEIIVTDGKPATKK